MSQYSKSRNISQCVIARRNGLFNQHDRHAMDQYAEDYAAQFTTHKSCDLPDTLRTTFVIAFSCNNQWIASAHGDHTIRICDIHTGQCFQTLSGHPRTPWTLAWHPKMKHVLASGCLGGQIRVWNLQGGSETYCVENSAVINSIAFSPKAAYTLFITTGNKLMLWDWREPAPCISVGTANPIEKIRLIKFHQSGDFLLSAITNVPMGDLKQKSQISSYERTGHQTADILHGNTSTSYDNSAELGRVREDNSFPSQTVGQGSERYLRILNDRADGDNSEEIIVSAVTISTASTETPRTVPDTPTVSSDLGGAGQREEGAIREVDSSVTHMVNAGGNVFHFSVGASNGPVDQVPIITARIKLKKVTSRLQWWDISSGCLPDLKAGPNIMSVSFSPLDRYIIAGFSCYRPQRHTFNDLPAASIYRICRNERKSSDSPDSIPPYEIGLEFVRDIDHYAYRSSIENVSTNIACWLPEIGSGVVYGTNRGHVIISHT
ncbi:uncharacterized protein TRIADDRAFT_51829 [Trichoplax adhaerens]|uniref:Uncharacterized protein n=1 Tax=Trichoplax adhaerens TaxID=10228 RepID=B3RL02_TRIAD|nr:hypothetical protein TRIADDRAFT_51829 [Trichoplax adhaerens]EDV28676.1 hypothetical protein TRIADDRAFT_51829 [Trichoplax adhaerens]|eukprot:XP_002107878.1 hypothetical protein TRIADDRAFT_51829 [Trichoplax adhaerens]